MSTEPVDRPSARVILIGPHRQTLLIRGGDPGRPEAGTWWFTPGGAVESGETPEEAARRELWEETGHEDVEWGCLVAERTATFAFLGVLYRAVEHFFVAYTADLEVAPGGLTELERESTEEFRWLDAATLGRLPEPVYPMELGSVLDGLCDRRYPANPWVWEE